jgi:hypothetical protein
MNAEFSSRIFVAMSIAADKIVDVTFIPQTFSLEN